MSKKYIWTGIFLSQHQKDEHTNCSTFHCKISQPAKICPLKYSSTNFQRYFKKPAFRDTHYHCLASWATHRHRCPLPAYLDRKLPTLYAHYQNIWKNPKFPGESPKILKNPKNRQKYPRILRNLWDNTWVGKGKYLGIWRQVYLELVCVEIIWPPLPLRTGQFKEILLDLKLLAKS